MSTTTRSMVKDSVLVETVCLWEWWIPPCAKVERSLFRSFTLCCYSNILQGGHIQEAQLLLGWPTVLPYSRRLCKSCGAFMQIGPFDDKEISIAASRSLAELTQNVNRSSHGHSTSSLKISCKSVQSFSHNVADKEISIATSRSFSELAQNVMRSSHGHSTPSLKISCKSVQLFCQNKPFCSNVADEEISIAASRGFSKLTQM